MFLNLSTGLILGLTAGFAPGPLLAFVISQSMYYGVREGAKAALAPLISDLPIILVAFYVVWRLAAVHWATGLLSFAGAGYIIYLAWGNLRFQASRQPPARAQAKSLQRGALVNLLNPHPFFFWLTVGIPFLAETWRGSPAAAICWVAGFYISLVGSKLALAVIVGRTRSFLTGRIYLWINRILGLVLILFALLLIKNGFTLMM